MWYKSVGVCTQELPIRLPPEHLYTCTVGRQRSQARCATTCAATAADAAKLKACCFKHAFFLYIYWKDVASREGCTLG